MLYTVDQIKQMLVQKDLKVTPQRLAILEAVYGLGNHPTAEKIIAYIRKLHPSIATGTVYKVLDVLVENKLINKVKTDKDIMRYEGIIENHHHLYSTDPEKIVDYMDEELDQMLNSYFRRKKIPGFHIDEIRLHINGKFE
jgi:Fur family peroxide stress response transcriptional regulator